MNKPIVALLIVLVCRIFAWGSEGPGGVTPEINEWLQNKKVIEVRQSSCSAGGGYAREKTYLTIIAETL